MLKVVCEHHLASVPREQGVGYELYSCEKATVPARGRLNVDTGITLQLPVGYYGRLVSLTGLAVRNGLHVENVIIEPNCQDLIKVLLFNHSDYNFHVKIGEPIAKLLLEPIIRVPVMQGETKCVTFSSCCCEGASDNTIMHELTR